MLLGADAVLAHLSTQARDTIFAVGDLPGLGRWIYSALTDPLMQGWLLGAVWRLAVGRAAGIGLGWLVQRVLRGPRARWGARVSAMALALEQSAAADVLARAESGEMEAPETPPPEAPPGHPPLGRRLGLALGHLGLDLAPVAAFLLGAHVVLATPLGGSRLTQLVMIAVVQALAVWRVARALMAALTTPDHPAARLLPVGDETAGWLLRWTTRIAGIALFATASLQSALLLGLPRQAHAGWLRIASLVCAICVVIMAIQRRRAVAGWLRGDGEEHGAFGSLRRMLAPVWHWLAIVYVAAVWWVWATEYGAGEANVLPALLATLVILILMRVGAEAITRVMERRLTPSAAMVARYPGIDTRVSGYRRLLRGAVSLAVFVAGLALLGEVWGVAPLRWLVASRTGLDLISGLATIGVTLLIALVVWEGSNLALARHMTRLAESQAARAARLRTLLPMLRTTLLIAILIVVGLTVLSQIGINIAPLLAGAGVLGIAIGFGSQKLVQDVITGLFLLLENAVQVGDVVTVAGASGVVEDLSIRSIRLRTEDGSIQIIPFSAVTSVTNMTRDFSQAVIVVQVSYNDDYDRVIAVMQDIATGMRADPAWETDILNDLEVWGLTAFDASGITIKCRLRCLPFSRWRVQREFNRRLKARFELEGIEIPYPHRKVIVEGKADTAQIAGAAG
jgi:small-conductance mechanosensitive channel